MIATVVSVDVKPECISAFVDATRYNHVNSRREPGNVRFDVLRDRNDPNKFILYEVYVDEAAAAAEADLAAAQQLVDAQGHGLDLLQQHHRGS